MIAGLVIRFDLLIRRYDGFERGVKAAAQLAVVTDQNKQQSEHAIQVLHDEDQIYKINQNTNWYKFKHALIRGAIYDNILY